MSFSLNPNLDVGRLAAEFQQKRRLRIENILRPEDAEAILDALANYTAWHLVYSDDNGRPVRLDNAQLEQVSEQELQAKVGELQRRAASSYQFMYKFYPIIDAIHEGKLTENSRLYDVATFVNSAEFIKFARQLTDTDSLVKMDPQASLYEAGHFLNVHDDVGDKRESPDGSVRRFAVVFGFTKNWSANWGGQTNFFSGVGDLSCEGLFPGFNCMTVFEVPVLHSVGHVSPFATKGRYSVTGWLRDDESISRTDIE